MSSHSSGLPRLFISHAGQDMAFADRLAKDLRGRGLDVWLDASHLGAGDFLSAISQALGQRDVLILVLSPAALTSPWVPLEVNAAIVRSRQGFMHPPIIVSASPVSLESIPPLWAPFNRIDATANYASALQLVLRALGVSPGPPTPPLAIPRTLPAATISVRPERMSLGTLLIISLFWFALTFHSWALQILLIPDQVIGVLYREAPGGTLAQRAAWVDVNKPITLGLVLAPGLIVALLANPFYGLLSDNTASRFGQRRPFILGGTLLNIVGLLLMAFTPLLVVQSQSGGALTPSILALTGALMLVQLGTK